MGRGADETGRILRRFGARLPPEQPTSINSPAVSLPFGGAAPPFKGGRGVIKTGFPYSCPPLLRGAGGGYRIARRRARTNRSPHIQKNIRRLFEAGTQAQLQLSVVGVLVKRIGSLGCPQGSFQSVYARTQAGTVFASFPQKLCQRSQPRKAFAG